MNELTKRILSAIVLLTLYLFSFLYSTFYYIQLPLLAGVLVYYGLTEFYRLTARKDVYPFLKISIAYSLLILAGFYLDFLYNRYSILQIIFFRKYFPFYISGFGLTLFLLFVMMVHSFVKHIFTNEILGAAYIVAVTVLGVIYIAVPFGIFMMLLAMPDGLYYILFLSVVTIMNDTGAYFGGKNFGKHTAGIKASPNKTKEGYFTGALVAVLSAILFNFVWSLSGFYDARTNYMEVIFLALIVAFLADMGDLAESVLKRDAGVKDSSQLIPGHGGVLDRIDALLFTIPAVYFYAKIREIILRLM